jgi:hypothetical protein
MTTCDDLALALSTYGIHVELTFDGDEEEDGDVIVAAAVHVRVPTFGEAPRVIVNAFGRNFRCYPPRTSVAELASDIRCALDDVPLAISSGSVH